MQLLRSKRSSGGLNMNGMYECMKTILVILAIVIVFLCVGSMAVMKYYYLFKDILVNCPPTLKRWDGLRVSTDVLPK